ncbi:MAG: phosphate ABC transporter permease PstA [Propionibacteriaceae bacterium]|jgi:phosphate transport system permease protein|nr:phosphate ABC transporter permease PstA [Propionibacteriaceae bacterium]
MTALAAVPPTVRLPLTLERLSRRRRWTELVAAAGLGVACLAALLPLGSLIWTVLSRGLARLDAAFFTQSLRGVVGAGGGALHAIVGTALITALTALIAVPVGLLTAVYLVEYGRGWFPRAVTFLVDVMTGLPSIVAGLFAYAVFSLILGPGARSGAAGAVALSLLMTPVVVKAGEEMLRLVPNDLREAAWGLGAETHRVVLKVVLPTARSGLISAVMLGLARIVGETAPLLLVAGFTDSMNYDPLHNRMATLPVYIYSQWQNKGTDAAAYDDRAWTAAGVLIGFVLAIHLLARLAGRLLAPKTR